ncbi:tubulin domain-containing protein [Schizothecium vesticola]|uniref:Tubulin domain-containing protein n=1 Tax=Schizothecium vesticola TaxID=314040 RepID=A0AA40EHL5_9PEZI|nr:tubulin domain-containing protein [Schizothecium vesticola]
MHEILTLQLGQQANYLATHFWNAQESYFTYSPDPDSPVDHDIHWRPGLAADGHTETYTPRTVIYDLKGGFGSLRKLNALYDDPNSPPEPLWTGPTALHRQPPIPASAYQTALEAGLPPPQLAPAAVRYWSDFNRVYYHPRSLVQLSEYALRSSLQPFERHASGAELFAQLDAECDVVDRDLRPFAEEADGLQGVQIVCGSDDAWAGFGAGYLERVRDEFGKLPIVVVGVEGGGEGGVGREKRLVRLGNQARWLSEVYRQASLVVPLALPKVFPRGVGVERGSAWHTMGLLAAAWESVTLPTRLREGEGRTRWGEVADGLNVMGRQTVAGLQMSVEPAGEGEGDGTEPRRGKRLSEEEQNEGAVLDMRFEPSYQLDQVRGRMNGLGGGKTSKVFSQVVAMRGYPPDEDDEEEEEDQDVRNLRRRRNADGTITKSYHSQLRFPLLDSFPQIFKDQEGQPIKDHVNVTTSLSTDSSVSEKMKLLRTTVVRSIGLEDREMVGNDLAEMAEEYHEGWSSGSDEGDDE